MIGFSRYRVSTFLLMVLLASCTPAPEGPELTFDAAWVRAAPPGHGMTAGFGTLTNHGPDAIELVGFGSPTWADVSLHRTELVDGVSRMREVESLTVPADGSVELAPGGYHLMLMMPAGPAVPGDKVTVTMTTADGRTFLHEVPVERR